MENDHTVVREEIYHLVVVALVDVEAISVLQVANLCRICVIESLSLDLSIKVESTRTLQDANAMCLVLDELLELGNL